METPQLFWMRVSMGLFLGDSDNRSEKVIDLYRLYKGRRFCSSTPTLFNSATHHSQLSSCYLYKVDDSIESIMQRGIAENAYLSKWAGGLGGSWTAVRGTGSYIQGTNGESQGVIPFLKLHNDQLVAVNQGGKRRGSGCAYLESWHTDILDFLDLRKNTGDDRRRAHDMNTANWIPDLFMKRMEAREDWTLFRSNEVPDLHDLYGSAFEQRYQEYEEKAKNGEIICASQAYTTKGACTKGAKSLILNCKKKKSFKVLKNKAGKFFFNVIAGNNKVIATSQGYKSESSLNKGIESVQKNATKKNLS